MMQHDYGVVVVVLAVSDDSSSTSFLCDYYCSDAIHYCGAFLAHGQSLTVECGDSVEWVERERASSGRWTAVARRHRHCRATIPPIDGCRGEYCYWRGDRDRCRRNVVVVVCRGGGEPIQCIVGVGQWDWLRGVRCDRGRLEWWCSNEGRRDPLIQTRAMRVQ